MTRLLLLSLLLFPPLLAAQAPPVKLTVSPAAEPKPALRYELLTPGREKVSGNAAHHYLKAMLARPAPDRGKAGEDDKKVLVWEEAAIDKLPADEVKEYLTRYAAAFRELEYGARCKACEWATAPAAGPDAVAEVVGAVQGHRELARFLALRVRLELAEKRYDDATRTLRAGVQYGKHLAEGGSLIQMLVGVAITNVFLAKVDEFVARPGAPNLYWGLSSLPRPLIDPRPSLDGEDALNESFLPGLAYLRKGPVSAERALDVAENALRVMAAASGEESPLAAFGARVGIAGYASLVQAEAKKELLTRGHGSKDVDAMPAVQAVFLNSFETYREVADDHRKWFLMPHADAIEGMAQAAEKGKRLTKEKEKDPLLRVFLLLLPAWEKVHQSGMRTDRKVAALRAVEAIRLHADAAGGVPKQLSDVKKVPVPDDPVTAKSFEYAATADGFTLSAPAVNVPPQKGLELRYEVKLRK
jgi:hypothetical protein